MTQVPFPNPDPLDDDGLASLVATLDTFTTDARRVFDDEPNPVTKWVKEWHELTLDYCSQLMQHRLGLEAEQLDGE